MAQVEAAVLLIILILARSPHLGISTSESCGSTGWEPLPSFNYLDIDLNAPGDRLCSGSFSNFGGGQEKSFWILNMYGLKFENGSQMNSFNAYYSLNNGVTDATMNTTLNNTFLGNGYPLKFFQDILPHMFSNGDIYSKWEDGVKYWFVTKHGAIEISRWASNVAAGTVAIPAYGGQNPAAPGNTDAQKKFRTIANSIVNSFLPGSVVQRELHNNTPNGVAIYSPTCN